VKTNRWRKALSRTRRSTLGRLASLLGTSELTPAFWEQLEETLIGSDVGIGTVQTLVDDLKRSALSEGLTQGGQIRQLLRSLLIERLPAVPDITPEAHPFVIILVGVNGSGKTTAAARIARRWQETGHSVLLAAADTYRAAAKEQLIVWGNRLGVDVIAGQPGSDPGAVVYDACQATLSRHIEVLIVDTSGRMHTQHNLMAEVQKICRVAGKVISGAPHLVLLVLDATTGQNGLSQAQAFADAIDVNGVVLAKLDSSAKGGVGLAIAHDLHLPIIYAGLGEGLDDLATFDAAAFVDGLLTEAGAEHERLSTA
jgi:fused signal recognition particle receptor